MCVDFRNGLNLENPIINEPEDPYSLFFLDILYMYLILDIQREYMYNKMKINASSRDSQNLWFLGKAFIVQWMITIENRIYIRGEFTRKKCKTAILLYCFHTAGVLHIFML